MDGLDELEQRVRFDLACLNYPPAHWVVPATHASGGPVSDVAVIGAGMAGLVLTFSLRATGSATFVASIARRFRRAVGDLCADGDAALAEGADRAGGRDYVTHVPCLVRSTVWCSGMGGARQDPA